MAVPCTKGGYGTSSDDVTKPIQASTRLTCHGSLLPCKRCSGRRKGIRECEEPLVSLRLYQSCMQG